MKEGYTVTTRRLVTGVHANGDAVYRMNNEINAAQDLQGSLCKLKTKIIKPVFGCWGLLWKWRMVL